MRTREYLYLIPVYAFTVGLLYVWSFWGSFGINPLEYMGIEDVAKTAIIPLASSLIIFVVGNLVSEFISRDVFPYGGGPDTALRRAVKRHERFIFSLFVMGVATYALFGASPLKWFLISGWAGWGFAIVLNRQGFLQEITNPNLRSVLLFILSALPIFAYAVGGERAEDISEAREFAYVVHSNIQAINDQANSRNPCDLRLIGRIGDVIFVMSYPEKRLLVANVGPGDSIVTEQAEGCVDKLRS